VSVFIGCWPRQLGATLVIGITLSAAAIAGEESSDQQVAARVDGAAITVSEVNLFRRQNLTLGQSSAAEETPWLDAMALEQLVRQRLVVGYLKRTRQGASPEQIDAEIARLKADAQRQQIDWAPHLAKHYGDEDSLARYLSWRLGWSRYVRKQSTDAGLEAFFEQHRRDFDGTRLRVSQILWKARPGDEAARQQALAAAAQVRQQLLAGQIAFADAVAQYSQAPSRQQQGDLGFITRHGEMHEAFSRAAFALEPGAISMPVATPHGIHLIRCTEVKPGTRGLAEVRTVVEEQFAVEMFDRIVAAERKRATIELSSDVPRFDPASGKLITP
jgi:parvulin-like peptidyl-prolyl isomerase